MILAANPLVIKRMELGKINWWLLRKSCQNLGFVSLGVVPTTKLLMGGYTGIQMFSKPRLFLYHKNCSFESDCAHTMVRDAADGTFSIVVQNTEGCREKPLDCYRLIKIYYQDKEYVLKRSEVGIPIFVTPKRVLPIPGQLPGIRTEMSAHFIVVSLDTVGAKIKWDGQVAKTLVFSLPIID